MTTETNKHQNRLQKVLLEGLNDLKAKNAAYSLRSYARKLGISPSALSEMMTGKRGISSKTAQKIFDRLNLSPSERESLQKLERSKKALVGEKAKFLQVEMDQYHMISEWYYFAILSLAETVDFKEDHLWIAKRLNIRTSEVKTALLRLERLKLLGRNQNGVLVPTGASFKTTSDMAHAALRKSHADNLDLAKNSLERDSIELRDMSSMTMAIDPALLPEAKILIQDFRRKLTQFLESQTKQEVYKLNIQLFPLTEKKEGMK
jgi:uncharacterized protein (TIGR02147 family)